MKTIRIVGLCTAILLISTSLSNAVTIKTDENLEQLKKLGEACLMYMQDHNGQMPPSLSTLFYQAYVNDLNLFSSPSKPIGILERSEIDEKSDYVLCPEKGAIIPENPDMIAMKLDADKFRAIIRDRSRENNPKGKAMFVFFSDGSVSTLRAVMALEDESADRERIKDVKKVTKSDQSEGVPSAPRGGKKQGLDLTPSEKLPPKDDVKLEPRKDDQKTYPLAQKTGDQTVEVVRDFFPGHPLYIDIESSYGDTGILTSKKAFELRPGKYRIEFNLVGDPLGAPRRVRFRVGDIYDDEVTLGVDEMVRAYKRNIVVTTPSTVRLVFRHQGGDFQSLLLDSVRLTKLTGQNR